MAIGILWLYVYTVIFAHQQLPSLDQCYFFDISTILSNVFLKTLWVFREIDTLKTNSFYLLQTVEMANKKGDLQILMYRKEVKTLGEVKVSLENYKLLNLSKTLKMSSAL